MQKAALRPSDSAKQHSLCLALMLSGVAAAETTMADHFLRGGWRTHAIGKWHAVRASSSTSSSGPAAGQLRG